jgi:lysophospholipase L1-like esterase
MRDYTEIFHQRIRFELARAHDAVIRTAISGWTTRNTLADIERRILRYKPTVLSIMLGVNDSGTHNSLPLKEFRDNYSAILDRAAECSNPALVMHTANPIWDTAKDCRGALPEYNDVVRELAAQRGAVLVDHDKYWTKMSKTNTQRLFVWMADQLHPNHYGHVAFAHEMFRALDIWDDNSVMCRLFKP